MVACRLALALVLAPGLLSAQAGRVVTDSVRSPALEGNRLGDAAVRPLRLYLPPSYATSDARYPVLYLLHGFGGSPSSWSDGTYRGLVIERAMDSLVREGISKEFIIAMVDGHNAYGGSVFTNSVVTGNWETYFVRDVIRHVDGRYRTLRRASSRGIAGHSMGGGAALRIAMRYPNGFGFVYAMSANAELPCQMPSATTRQQLQAVTSPGQVASLGFETQLCLGYGAAWSPDTARAPTFVALPFRPDATTDSAVVAQWESWRLLDMAPRYREGLVRLKGIALDVGTEDSYYPGQARLDSLLTRLRVKHRFEAYRGDHNNRIGERVVDHLLPWFSDQLDYGPAEQ
ncbi:MAG TPA: alpha/beta fold hydrolase [Gemmatimonadales bacterium]|nr:alpha/beta fold hydrolase [Gemmatimonadales bacterium]